ncbi:GH1 family beta-glucosidase [Dinghuibacter silviterrae]|uniref:Beta-glucosidase n=1 Tax=Dinghuibacter silviterrae TaxID=1539049 RepID=A0A4R8DRA4_9BACT|nr:GH1 family beta-glucosidase [Dinghuibacter silviterrae]TDW99660.1 beta-glucosidase [Dinghuibacter silviterrae]
MGNDSLKPLTAKAFGNDFAWGVAIAAAQNEGAYTEGGRGLSIWDTYSRRKGTIRGGAKPFVACDFYHRYKEDLLLTKALGFNSFRFSVSWSRVLPDGTGRVNKEGVRYYHDVIDECLRLGLEPFLTIYHWDLPLALQKEGGWTSFKMMRWFERFTTLCAEEFGSKVKNWIVLNEPAAFTALGYMLGRHAPGLSGLDNFFPAVHNAVLAQSHGGRILRDLVPGARIGTTFSCSEVIPYSDRQEDVQAAGRVDVLLNRLFVEPALGKGYPSESFRLIERLELYNKSWKYTERMPFHFDFIGLQNYFPVVVRFNRLIPLVQASEVKPYYRRVPRTAMGWEINGDGLAAILRRFWKYGGVKEIMVTENGAAFKDTVVGGRVKDEARVAFFKEYLGAVQKVRQEGVNVTGYFVWTLTDNFEWSEGYKARFGLVYVDHETQLRTIKDSGYWFRDFLTPA